MTAPGGEAPRQPGNWRSLFARSATAVFVVGPNRRLRYANPAWEVAVGHAFPKLRGMRLSRYRSGSDLGRTLMPPPEALAGKPTNVRRAAPGESAGPPWWDFTFVPLAGPKPDSILGIVGTLTVVGERLPKKSGGKLDPVSAEVRRELAAHHSFERIAGTTTAGERFLDRVRLAAAVRTPVKLFGEAGSGKGATARIIHHNGPSAAKPFAAVDCAGVQPYLNEAQLFGKGGVLSSLGTLYLADPGALPRDLQEKIVQALQRPTAPRLIWGTHLATDPRLLTAFEDRFAVLELSVPPLRERLEDLPWFVERILPAGRIVADDALAVLAAHRWPGNLRELAVTLGTAAAEHDGPIHAAHLPRVLRERLLIQQHPIARPETPLPLNFVLAQVERRMIEAALTAQDGSQTAAARQLGLSRAALGRRIESLGLTIREVPR